MDKSLITVTSPLLPDLDDFHAMLKEIWASKWITNNGSFHKQLEKELAAYLKVPFISLFTNGTLPLITALQALRITGEVITTPYSFVATTHALWWNGITPVFVDIDPSTGNMDPDKIEAAITPRTTAIMPVHVYGNVCNVEEIERIAHKYGLKVIYDAAHTFGVKYKGKGIASFGDVSCFSFHATKVFNSIEGGAACFKDKDFGLDLYRLKNFGIRGPETVDGVGANAKMNEFCAAMGICNLRHVEEEIEKRKKVVECYREHLSGIDGIQLSPIQENVTQNYAYFPVVFEEKIFGTTRNEVADALEEQGIGARKYFYPLTNAFECFHGKYDPNETPVALHMSKRVLTLPLYADLALDDVEKICEIILKCRN